MVGFQLHFSDLARIVEEPRFRRLVCAKCKLVAREPQSSVTCGHRFCRSCLHDMYQNLQNEIAICPVDGKEIREICSDDNEEVLALEVHCIFMDVGCKWKGELRHLKIHVDKYHPEGLASGETLLHNPSLTSGHPHGSLLFSSSGDCRLDYSPVERPNRVERPRPAENQQAQCSQQQGESVEINRELANLTMDFERLQLRMQRRGEHDATDQMKMEFANLRRDMERLHNRIQVLEDHVEDVCMWRMDCNFSLKRGSPSATRQEIWEAIEELKRQLSNERQDRERQQEEWQARLQAMERRTLAVFSAALEKEKRDSTRQLNAQRNSCEAFHDECVAERERTSDDRNMEVALLQINMEQLQNSHADLETRVRRLERH